MSGSGREYLFGGRKFRSGSLSLRRGLRFTGDTASTGDADENLDLFSLNRRSVSVSSSDDSSDASSRKLGRLSVGSAMAGRSRIDDLLSSTERVKNDYDWLLTPPATPQFDSSDQSKSQPTITAPTASSLSRSRSTTNASRLSEINQSSRPIRSSSATRSSSNSTSQFTIYSSNQSSSSILNTSSASVSSYITRSRSATRPSTRSSTSRPSTPSRICSSEKPKPPQISRPTTSASRSLIPTGRSSSRPSTPIRRNPTPSLSHSTSISTVHVSSRSTSSSPGPRLRPTHQPIIPPDFTFETPPNLRTTLPNRPLSAGRSRPLNGSSEITAPANVVRRVPSPVVSSRGRITVPDYSTGRGGTIQSSAADAKSSHAPELATKKPMKTVTNGTETTGFGRNISKKSMDMAMWHMDLRNSTSLRVPSSTTIYPQSIRSSASKTQQPNQAQHNNRQIHRRIRSPKNNGAVASENGDYSAKLSDTDTILLEEDLKNANWLHHVDDKSDTDSGLISDYGFEPLPEPFLRSD